MKSLPAAFLSFGLIASAAFANPFHVVPVTQQQYPSSSSPSSFASLDGTLYFTAEDGNTGRELWRSDGTAAGTMLVKDIDPGPAGSILAHSPMLGANGAVYFGATGPGGNPALWKSDGTAAGTIPLKDVQVYGLAAMIQRNGLVYFVAGPPTGTLELWRTDGTTADAALIASNDDWESATDYRPIYFSGLAPLDARESAVMLTLDPGAYTAIVRGAGTTGVAIVEVFRVYD